MDLICVICYHKDSPERERNLHAQRRWLQANGIQSLVGGGNYVDDIWVHKTRTWNQLALQAGTKWVGIWDTDCIHSHDQLQDALELLRDGIDFVYPYSGDFWRCTQAASKSFCDTLDIGLLQSDKPYSVGKNAVGGGMFVNMEAYIRAGMDNEHFVAYCPEDWERFERLKKFGSMRRVEGPLYHLHHPPTDNSQPDRSPYYKDNLEEFRRIKAMSKEELEKTLAEWPWVPKRSGPPMKFTQDVKSEQKRGAAPYPQTAVEEQRGEFKPNE